MIEVTTPEELGEQLAAELVKAMLQFGVDHNRTPDCQEKDAMMDSALWRLAPALTGPPLRRLVDAFRVAYRRLVHQHSAEILKWGADVG